MFCRCEMCGFVGGMRGERNQFAGVDKWASISMWIHSSLRHVNGIRQCFSAYIKMQMSILISTFWCQCQCQIKHGSFTLNNLHLLRAIHFDWSPLYFIYDLISSANWRRYSENLRWTCQCSFHIETDMTINNDLNAPIAMSTSKHIIGQPNYTEPQPFKCVVWLN